MRITLKFFASLREAIGSAQEELALPASVTTVGALRHYLQQRGAPWGQALASERLLRTARNQQMCDAASAIEEGDEIAFFPPVTGG